MRLPAPLLALLALAFSAVALAWTKDDYEIFDLVAALRKDVGPDASFYSELEIEPSATTAEIQRAFRKRSRDLHPDKNRGVPHAQERYARLVVISTVLKDSEKRDRYNFFYKNGVPTWKGFGYAYSRWRPGLGLVLGFIAALTAGMHYVVLRLNYTRDIARVAYFTEAAQKAARGAQGRRKVKVPMVEGGFGGDVLELVVDGDQVLLPHDDGTATPLDSLAPLPSFSRTWPVTLSRALIARAGGKSRRVDTADFEEEEEYEEEDTVAGFDVSEVDTPTPAARKSRAAELRAQRQRGANKAAKGKKGAKAEGEAEGDDSGASTPATATADESASAAEEEKKRKAGLGKAGAARRRKMALKK